MRKRKLFFIAAMIAASTTVFASDSGKGYQIVFSELPFSEGKIYLAATSGSEKILATMAEVESDTIVIPVDLSGYEGKDIFVQAFQDLNDNKKLDFDTYGRPLEPCVRTSLTLDKGEHTIELKLIQY